MLVAVGSDDSAAHCLDHDHQRLFFAVRPAAEAIDRLRQLNRSPQDGVAWIPPENWHVTLRFLGSAVAADIVEAVSTTELVAQLPAEVELGPEVTRLGSVAVLPARGLDEIARIAAAATAGLGTNHDSREFYGHLTLARFRNEGTPCDLLGQPFQSTFPASTIELITSEHSSGRSHYTTVHRWPPSP